MAIDFERVAARASRATARAEQTHVMALRRYLQEAHRRLERELRVAWPDTVSASTRLWREARARELLAQVDPVLANLRVGRAGDATVTTIRDAIVAGRAQEAVQSREIFEALARASTNATTRAAIQEMITGPRINWAAIEAQTANAAARLARHSAEAIEKINTAVVNGIVRGSGWRPVAREVKGAIIGSPPGHGGLAFHAETIARTELLSSLNDAREESYREADITQVFWVAVADERVCEWCGARSGRIYRLEDIVIPSHPRCRCSTAPWKPEWEAEGLLSRSDLEQHRADVLAEFREARDDPNARFATGPAPFERAAGMTTAPKPIEA